MRTHNIKCRHKQEVITTTLPACTPCFVAGSAFAEMGPDAESLKLACPELYEVVGDDLATLLDYPADPADESSRENNCVGRHDVYWDQVHLMFVFRVLVARTKSELAMATLCRRPTGESSTATAATPKELSQRLQLFRTLLQNIEKALENSTSVTGTVMTQFSQSYNLTPLELRVVQLLVTVKAQPSPSVLELLLQRDDGTGALHFVSQGDERMGLEHTQVRYACGATALDWAKLANEDHVLCSDRILIFEEEDYTNNKLAVSEEACRALMGMELAMEDKLKLSGTKLLVVLGDNAKNDGEDAVYMTAEDADEQKRDTTTNNMTSQAKATISSMLKTLKIGASKTSEDGCSDGQNDAVLVEETANKAEALIADAMKSTTDEESGEMISNPDILELETNESDMTDQNQDPTQPKAYINELEYLKDMFEMVMHRVLYSRQRVAQDLRKSSVIDNRQAPWMRGNEGAPKQSVGEISAKIKLVRRKIEISLELTQKEGIFYPRLELLVEQLQLHDFEKFVLVYLAGSMVSPIFKSCIKSDEYRGGDAVCVGALLSAYFDSFADQVAGRTYFYRTSTLAKKGLVRFCNYAFRTVADLTDQEILLDRRVLDCIVGLDKESTQISHGSHLYDPKVSLESVVLPDKLKETITDAVTHFEQFRRYRQHNPDFDDGISYGVGLTLMFSGPSGTGKTMTANAIAAKLGKKLLLVNFPSISQRSSSNEESSSQWQPVFREAELSDAIIFFDECESLFAKRSTGGSSDTTELLTELERHEGIVFLATNRPYDLDEAMYRRISEVFEFKAPNFLERLDIWKLVTSPKSVPCDATIDWEAIALQYELTGGFIKNAVMAALLDAVGRDPRSPVVTEEDIIHGCKKQVRGALQMVEFNERVVPRAGLEELVATDTVVDQLKQMVSLEKARGILFGSWGFDDDMRSRQGTTALFWGVSGTGRSRAAEAIGFELGKPLKVVDLPRLLEHKSGDSQNSGATSIRNVFRDARHMDAVLVLDGFALNTDGQGGHHGTGEDSRLLNLVIREMTRFPGVVIMNVDTEGSLDVFVSRLDKGLVSGLKFLIEFQLPTQSNRCILWKKLMPPTVPLAEEINYKSLAEASSSFNLAQIGNAIYRAAANAALRSDATKRCVSMKDLLGAVEEEKHRGESSVDRWVKAQYV